MKFNKSKSAEIRDREKQALDKELALYQTLAAIHSTGAATILAFLAHQWIHQVSFVGSQSFWVIFAAGLTLSLDVFYFIWTYFQRKRRLESEQSWDDITGAWSSAYFDSKLQEEIVRAGRYRYSVTLCVMDLDHFRSFNENFGPKRGDDLLKRFSVLIQSHIRATDLLARFEDDAFYMMLPHTDLIRAERVIERLLENSIEELDIKFRAGLTAYQVGENAMQFENRAKVALEHSRREGNKRVQCLVSDGENYTAIEF